MPLGGRLTGDAPQAPGGRLPLLRVALLLEVDFDAAIMDGATSIQSILT